MHVDDMADAAVFLMLHYDAPEIINVGVGSDIAIRELAEMICRVVGYQGKLLFDPSKADGTPQKLLDVSRLHSLGWRARIGLEQGIAATYDWFVAHQHEPRHAMAI